MFIKGTKFSVLQNSREGGERGKCCWVKISNFHSISGKGLFEGVKIYQLTLAALLPYYHITGNLVAPDISDVLEEVEDSEASVMVTVIINNHSGHKMVLEEVDIGCGMISNNSALPEILDPDSSYIVYTEKVRPWKQRPFFLFYLLSILKVFIMTGNCEVIGTLHNF